jgi:hypothetical protein
MKPRKTINVTASSMHALGYNAEQEAVIRNAAQCVMSGQLHFPLEVWDYCRQRGLVLSEKFITDTFFE